MVIFDISNTKTIKMQKISGYQNAPRFSHNGTHESCVTKTYVSPNKFYIGVSYWTVDQIMAGERMGQDGSKQVFMGKLYV